MRIKGRYVAQIEINFDFKYKSSMRPFEEIKENIVHGELTDAIKDVIVGEIADDYGSVTVTQQYADMYEVRDETD